MVQPVPLFACLSEQVESAALRVISCGLGVQSTALVLAASIGMVGPMPDLAIWADPGGERREIRDHLAWLRARAAFPIHDVNDGDLEQELHRHFATGSRAPAIPWKIIGLDGKKGQAMRQCTSDKKIRPVRREIRRMLGVAPRCRVPKNMVVEQWLGISTDEVERQTYSPVKYIVHRYPFFEMGWSRTDCENFLATLYPEHVVHSTACVFCPFMDNARWRKIRTEPQEWARAIALDEAARRSPHSLMRGTLYLHHSRVPLADADLEGDDQGQGMRNECGGHCGV